MRILFLAATALTLSGSALAYQTDPADPTNAVTTTYIAVDPSVAISPPPTWNDEQRMLWEQHMAALPASWTTEQREMFNAMILAPPANWTAEQRALYEAHMASLPASWTTEQRQAYDQQVAALRTPWLAAQQTAAVDQTAPATTYAAAQPVSSQIIQPSNANPEHDARGIAVISDPAVVPAGYNGFAAGAGMGGPLVDPATGETVTAADNEYPPCTASVTDNCIQLYERGVRAALAGPNGSTARVSQNTGMGGPIEEGNDNTAEDDAIDVDTRPDGTIDVDGDLDNDGDNDLE